MVAAFVVVAGTTVMLTAMKDRQAGRSNSMSTPPIKHVPDPQAEELYLKGEFYLQKRTPESLNQALDSYSQALIRDPSYAEAYVGLANCYNLLREYTLMPPEEAYPRALAAARQAIVLDDSLAGVHSALAFVDSYWLWDSYGAEREFKRAIELDPNSVSAHHWYATFLLHLGRFEQAMEEINRAQRLTPSSPAVLADKGLILFFAGHPNDAIALLKQLEAAEPAFLSPHTYLATISLETGSYPIYLAESIESARLLRDPYRLSIAESGQQGLNQGGYQAMLQAILARQITLYQAGHLSAFSLALTYARLGRSREAIDYLTKSCDRREPDASGLRVDLGLRTLHNNPEYRKLLTKAGFPPL
ncbi:Adenylate cyclase [Acidisarcina polymorpha]|uniref:Adenylate cyclase n=1 Tax=Acidisarcina polymorpha TaxID=2211140 RepID=A0A2Z5FVY7_9BACT|nr:Adenylate cyclase [Acidisarcina polymorpha]